MPYEDITWAQKQEKTWNRRPLYSLTIGTMIWTIVAPVDKEKMKTLKEESLELYDKYGMTERKAWRC